MKILITNDDGIHAKGILSLAKELEKRYEVVLVAPETQKSACGHSITVTEPLFIKEVKIDGLSSKCYSVNGTPADCVKISVEKMFENDIDMIVSGINKGGNLGTDVVYSGTVSAAIESSICKIPSAAVSLNVVNGDESYEAAAKYAGIIIDEAIKNHLDHEVVLNINIPDIAESEIKGIKVCELGNRIYTNCFVEKILDDNTIGYHNFGEPKDEEGENTDVHFIKKGYVTVTPLHYDLTNFKLMNRVNGWFK